VLATGSTLAGAALAGGLPTAYRNFLASLKGTRKGAKVGAPPIQVPQDALKCLGQLMSRFIQANTMYKESGPVIETPLPAAQSLHDMVCQSWGGVIRVFPALPTAWKDLAVHNFRTQGAFLLSAVREGGTTRWVRLVSEAGAPCVVRHGIAGAVDARDGRGSPLRYEDAGDGRDPDHPAQGRLGARHGEGSPPRPERRAGHGERAGGALGTARLTPTRIPAARACPPPGRPGPHTPAITRTQTLVLPLGDTDWTVLASPTRHALACVSTAGRHDVGFRHRRTRRGAPAGRSPRL